MMQFEDKSIVFSRQLQGMMMPRMLVPHPESISEKPAINGIYIGRCENLGMPVFWNSDYYPNGHCCVLGMTGSGKTFFVKSFIARALLFRDTEITVSDWTGEYVNWALEAGGTVIDMSNGQYNFMIADDDDIELKIIEILETLKMAAGLVENELVVVHDRLMELYSNPETMPSISGLVEILEDKSIEMKLRKNWKLLSRIMEGRTRISAEVKNKRPFCIDLSKIEVENHRVVIAYLVITQMLEKMRKGIKTNRMIVIDEAWKLLDKPNIEMLIREGRKYGYNVVLSTQNARDIGQIIFSNMASLFVFRLQSHEERDSLAESLSLDKEFGVRVANLERGQCMCSLTFNDGKSERFFVKRIEGEGGIVWYRIGGAMDFEIEKEFFAKRLREAGMEDGQVNESVMFVENSRNEVSLNALCKKLTEKGMDRVQLIAFLRSIELKDNTIVNVIAELQEQTGNMVDLEMVD